VIRVTINGREHELDPGSSAQDAALAAGVDPEQRGVAVAVDGEVVPRSRLASTVLADGQSVEVVAAIGGGS
jgi:sulfur carrier protein